MYSMHNEGKSAIAERFIRTLKNKVYKYITSISENVYIDKLDNIVNKYNNAYHSTIKIKPVEVKSNTYIDSSKEINDKILNLKFVILLEYQNIKTFLQKSVSNWFEKNVLNSSEEVFAIEKVKNIVSWRYAIGDFKGEELVGTFYKKELQTTNRKEFRVEKVIKSKGNKL